METEGAGFNNFAQSKFSVALASPACRMASFTTDKEQLEQLHERIQIFLPGMRPENSGRRSLQRQANCLSRLSKKHNRSGRIFGAGHAISPGQGSDRQRASSPANRSNSVATSVVLSGCCQAPATNSRPFFRAGDCLLDLLGIRAARRNPRNYLRAYGQGADAARHFFGGGEDGRRRAAH